MTANLTEGAVSMMCSNAASSTQGSVQPVVVQIYDLRLVNSPQQQQQQERYRVMLSDGVHLQQGMLATQKNELVKNGRLQKGSVVRMTQYVCSVIQHRLIIIIIDLDLLLEKCDPIGEPRQFSSTPTTPVAGSFTAMQSPVDRPSVVSSSVNALRPDYSQGGSHYNNSDLGKSTASGYPKEGSVAGITRPTSYSGMHENTNMGFRNPGVDVPVANSNTYARQPQSVYQQPPPMYSNRGPIAKNEAPARIIPIAALNPYQGRWTIKARVTAKAELRHYNNTKGDGKVFSFDVLDSDGGEIRVTCFNAVADQFYNQIEVGKVYFISKGSLKVAQKAFNHLRNDQEITLDNSSTIQPCYEDDNSIPHQQFHFRHISDLESMENNSIVDVIGVVSSISPSSSITRKNGGEIQKRSLYLKDMSIRNVEVTLWGSFCNKEGQTLQNMCDSGISPILAIKSARVSEFNGKAIGTISTSQLFIDPDFPEAQGLKEWFEKEGRNMPTIAIGRETSRPDLRKTITQIKDEKLGTSEKPDWITVSATISFVKVDNFCYTACPILIGDRQCNKKVINNGDGKWRCDRCDKSVDTCDYRYLLNFQIQDHTGLTWVTAFQESGEDIMGVPAKDLYCLKYEEQDDESFAEVIRKVLFTKFVFKLKVKEETYSDEQRVKSTVVKAEKVNFCSESKHLLELMDKLKVENYMPIVPKPENSFPGYGNVGNNNINNFGTEIGMQANQVGQYGNQYSGSRVNSSIPTTGSYISCNSCGGSGHNSTNCPSIMSGPGQLTGGGYMNRSGPGLGAGATNSGECFKCHQTGHWARDCPGLSAAAPPAYGSNSVVPGRYGGSYNQRVGGF